MQENNVLTVPEAATYLRISLPTMYNLVNRADFPKVKSAGRSSSPVWIS